VFFLTFSCSVYKEELYLPLIKTIIHFSHNETVIILGMSKSFISSKFFDYLDENQIFYEKIPNQEFERIFHQKKKEIQSPTIDEMKNIGIFFLSLTCNSNP
jgi:hypothetical protein